MTIWQAILFGIIQGATEFLPVSSSGHLVLFNIIFGIQGDFIGFSVFLHVATLVAVIIVLRKEIWHLIKHPFSHFAKKLYLSTLITIIIALIFKDTFKSMFGGRYLPICFMLTAILLVATEFVSKRKDSHPLSYKTSVVIGLMQGLAIIPGISRSGATICGGVIEGANKNECANFSFILSIPIILGSMIMEIYDCAKAGTSFFNTPALQIILSFLTALIVGVVCVKLMLKLVKKAKFYPFAIYLIIISIITLFII